MTDKPVRHLLGLSGGKDSSALAVYMRDRVPEMEYFFTDTQKELPETYEFLDKLEAYLQKPIHRLNADRGFDHWLEVNRNYLPSARMRWCTRLLKIAPFEKFAGDDKCVLYVGIRADEDRSGYVTTKPNIEAKFPFQEDGIKHTDVLRILEKSGVGLPSYYEWRTRSGCYFCFFQRKSEWTGLLERHPDLFEKAKEYEKLDPDTGQRYTWQQGESLDELARPERIAEINERAAAVSAQRRSRLLVDILDEDSDQDLDDGLDEKACHWCYK
jgi:hypothetical protein